MSTSNTRWIILALFMFIFLLKAFYLDKFPIEFDGTLYAEMIAEEAEEPTFLPRYLGMWAPWKPGLYFITYSFFLPFTSHLFDSIEWIYKSPNLIFSAVNAFIFYLIAKRFTHENVALAASLLFYSSYGVIYTDSRLLMETFSLTTILISLLFYTWKGMEPKKRFLCAGAFALFASLTKSVISFMILPLAIAYAFKEDKKTLKDPFFLFSLLSPLAGFILFYLALDSVGLVEEILVKDTGKFFVFNYIEDTPSNIIQGTIFFFFMFWAYLVISFRKMLSSWKEHLFFTAWLVISIIPLISGVPMPWHFYYVAPPLAFFAAIALSSKGDLDSFSLVLIILLVALNSIFFLAVQVDFEGNEVLKTEAKEVGLMLSGKENVLIVGYYAPSTIIASYKMLSERRDSGVHLDFGYALLHVGEDNSIVDDFTVALNEIVANYDTEKYDFEEENFADMFQTKKFLKKKTSIEHFDYVVVSPPELNLTNSCYIPYYNGTYAQVYVLSEKPECN